jgi:hypothetical protein
MLKKMNFKYKTQFELYEASVLNEVFPDRKIEFLKEELTNNEKTIIAVTYNRFKEKLEDIKILQDEITRISVENANLKSYNDNRDYDEEE